MLTIDQVLTVHLEISSRCNAACPGCPRNTFGVNSRSDYPLHDMRLDEAKFIFTPDFLKQLRVVFINGNLGDFVTARDGVDIVKYFLNENPDLDISISTNAGVASHIWQALGELNVKVLFCIDGLADTHKLYRQQTNWGTVIDNAKTFINHGGRAVWKMIPFDHNRHQIDQCRKLSLELGFCDFILVDSDRTAFPAFTQKKEFSHNIGVHDYSTSWQDIKNIEIKNTPQQPFKKIRCQSKPSKSIYVTATREVYLCCYTGFYPKQMQHVGNDQIKNLLDNISNNALEVGLGPAMSWFNKLQLSWHSHQQPFICNQQCGMTR